MVGASRQTPFTTENGTPSDAYETLQRRLKEHRRRALIELAERGGEASASVLKDDDGAAVPRDSFDHHLAWLKGEDRNGNVYEWWPDEVGPLAEVVRREDRGYRHKTRIIGLTEHGEQFIEQLLDKEGREVTATIEDVQAAAQSNTKRLNDLVKTVDDLQDDVAALEEDGSGDDAPATQKDVDAIMEKFKSIEGRLSDIECTLSKHDDRIDEIVHNGR